VAVPTWTVEIAFASDPLSTSPTWVDVSSYVLSDGAGPGIRIERGRTSPLDDFRTGRASFRLRNTDRRFDPLHASGPYFGQLLPGRQVRIRSTANAVTVDQFRGFVRGWPQSFDDAGYWAYVDVECYDGLGWLSEARTTTGDGILANAVNNIGSLQLFLRQISGDTWFDASGVSGNFRGSSLSSVSSFIPSAINSDAGRGVAGSPAQSVTGVGWQRTSGAWSVSFWVRTAVDWSSLGALSLVNGFATSPNYDFAVGLDSGGKVRVSSADATNGGYFSGGPILTDARPHHIVITSTGGDPTIYVDGATISASETVTGGTGFAGVAGITRVQPYVAAGDPGDPLVQDVAAWNVALSPAQVAEFYALGVGSIVETTTGRAGRILEDVGWPSAFRDLTGEPRGTCSWVPFNGAQAMNLLRAVEATEQGRLFVSKDGAVTLHHRYYTTEETRGSTIQATFSDDGSDIAYSVGGYDQDVDDVLNAVTVSLVSGSSSESTNSSSITTYGRKSETINTLLPNLDLALNMAQGVVLQRKDVLTRIRPVEPAIELTAANWATVLGLEIGDRIRLEMTPSRTGSQLQQSATVEGVSIEANVSHTRVSFEASPIPSVTWFTVGSSTLGGSHVVAF